MLPSYSPDLRERDVSLVLSVQSCRFAAIIFGVNESSAIRRVRRYREIGGGSALLLITSLHKNAPITY